MTDIPYRTALIVGAGPGISASVARGLAAAGLRVGLAARNVEKLAPLAAEIRAQTFAVDATDPARVARLFDAAGSQLGEPDVVLYNASARAHGSIAEPDPADRPDSTLDPDGIAQTYLDILRQPRSAWSLEVELRPWVETF